MTSRQLLLAAGTQSSGSTLVSWCFLQRPDLDGVLDARFDRLPDPLPQVSTQVVWCKMTVACFRLTEAVSHFRDGGWDVRPMLIVRDVRAVFNSLIAKPYGRNGTTSDDPPIRLRLRRFLEDYSSARERGWPVLRFEDFYELGTAEKSLRAVCDGLGLAWHESMLTWPKPIEQVADPRHGNETFQEARGAGLAASIRRPGPLRLDRVPREDLDWLESAFAQFNRDLGYPEHVDPSACPAGRAIPRFEVTRSAWRQRPRGWKRLRHWWASDGTAP